MKTHFIKFIYCITITTTMLLSGSSVFAQLTVTASASAATLASTLAGPGATISNVTMTCPAIAEGTFTSTGTLLAMSSGIMLTNGHASAAAGAEPPLTSFNNGTAGDPSFVTLGILPAGTSTFDACELEFDVVATGDTIGFNYQLGSEEYRTAVCSPYNDAFAFFISGPGIIGTPNMALVPGTTLPVEINTVNDGIPGTSGGVLSNCTSIGAGSPFTAYYLDNTGGTLLAYRGYTDKFRAYHAVTPCDTYHLKLAIVDAGNAIYDSGVFLEAGSLQSNSIHFDHSAALGATIDGIPNAIVKGCTNATIGVISTPSSSSATTIHLTYGGTGTFGTDFTSPDSVTIPGGDTSTTFTVAGLPTPAAGTKTVKVYLSGGCGITDSITLSILDTPSAHILTPDTAVCGASVLIATSGTAGLTYAWTPPTGLSSPSVPEPTATPTATTTYTMTATLPGSGCPPIVRTVTISVGSVAIAMLTPDTTICIGNSINLQVAGSVTLSYSWSPASGLSSATVQDPIATPTVTTTYTVTASDPGSGCGNATQVVTISVSNIADSILTQDTSICLGNSFVIRTSGTPGLTYNWTPTTGVTGTTSADPTVAPTVSTIYTLTATIAGCPTVYRQLAVTVDTLTLNILTSDTTICLGNDADLITDVTGTGTYLWTPATGLSNPTIADPVATPTVTTTYSLTFTPPSGVCPAVTKAVTITVMSIADSIITPDTAICSGNSILISTQGTTGLTYSWNPATGLSSPSVANPTANPTATTTYSVTVSAPGSGCLPLTRAVTITVEKLALTMNTPDTTICYGYSAMLNITANPAYHFSWTPTTNVSGIGLQDPVVTPLTSTAYTVVVDSPGSVCPPLTGTETVNVIPAIPTYTKTDSTPCQVAAIRLYGFPSGTNYAYAWSGPAGFTSTLQDPVIDSPVPANQGEYHLIVTDNTSGCSGVDSVFATYTQDSKVELTNVTTTQTIKLGQSITLNADSALYFLWYPDNGTLSNPNINDPVATPFATTTYYVIGTNIYGCRDTDSVRVEVIYDNFFIPSAFSPNGDGLNDVFRVGNLGYYKVAQMSIFDRWGEMIFNDISGDNKGWNGTYNNQPAGLDVYYYYIVIMQPDGKKLEFKGDITLLR